MQKYGGPNRMYHLRAAPLDPLDKKRGAKVGSDGELYNPQFGELKPRILKERMTFAGGFKIMEGEDKKEKVKYFEDSEEELTPVQDISGVLTKEQILKQLQLDEKVPTPGAEGMVAYTDMSRMNLSKTIIEDLSKEVSKLQRQKEMMERKKEFITTGQVKDDETTLQKGYKIKTALEQDEGARVLHAEPNRIQLQRHQTGQLGGLGEITLEEIQELRKQNQDRLISLEEQYLNYKSAKEVGSAIMDKFFPNIKSNDDNEEFETAQFNPHEVVKEPSFKYKDFGKGDAKTKMENHVNKNKFGDRTKPYYMQGVPSKSEPKIGRYKKEFEKENQVNNSTKDLWNEQAFFTKTGKCASISYANICVRKAKKFA